MCVVQFFTDAFSSAPQLRNKRDVLHGCGRNNLSNENRKTGQWTILEW